MEELVVCGVVGRAELVVQRVGQDEHPAPLHYRRPAVHVEEVTQCQAAHENRVHRRVHVVRADERHAEQGDVRLPVNRDTVLLVVVGQRLRMHCVGRAGVDRDQFVGRRHREEHLALQLSGHGP